MNKFYVENKDDLRVLIVNTARKKNVSEAVIEKDYWVTFILDYLFNENKWKEYFTFKGGTSLSKCFGLIERFSEIEKDYKAMSEMIYGEYPNFEEIIKVLQELEKEINK